MPTWTPVSLFHDLLLTSHQEMCNIILQTSPLFSPQVIANNYHLVDPDGNVILPRLLQSDSNEAYPPWWYEARRHARRLKNPPPPQLYKLYQDEPRSQQYNLSHHSELFPKAL
jgi:hypothetical protein